MPAMLDSNVEVGFELATVTIACAAKVEIDSIVYSLITRSTRPGSVILPCTTSIAPECPAHSEPATR